MGGTYLLRCGAILLLLLRILREAASIESSIVGVEKNGVSLLRLLLQGRGYICLLVEEKKSELLTKLLASMDASPPAYQSPHLFALSPTLSQSTITLTDHLMIFSLYPDNQNCPVKDPTLGFDSDDFFIGLSM